MRAHGHGGSLLVVLSGSERWRESIVHPVLYSVSPSFAGPADLIRRSDERTNTWDTAERLLIQWPVDGSRRRHG